MNLTRIGMISALLATVIGGAEDKKTETTSSADSQALTEYFAGRLMLMHHSTILMSNFAAGEASSDEVREFADNLHKSHAELNRQLSECAPKVVSITTLHSEGKLHSTGFRGSPPVGRKTDAQKADRKRDRDEDRDPGEEETGVIPKERERENATDKDETRPEPSDRREGAASAETSEEKPQSEIESQKTGSEPLLHRVLEIERRATENYLQSSTEMLSKYEGQDFDMGFLGFQIGAHTRELAELKAMESVGDEKFQKLIAETTEQIQKHLKEAQKLSEKHEDDE